jgi:hypothetical protein
MGAVVSSKVYTGPEAIQVLQRFRDIHTRKPFSAARAQRICEIARELTYKAEPCVGGIAGVRYRGNVSGRPGEGLFEIEDHTGDKSSGRVSPASRTGYTQEDRTHTNRRKIMPARTRTRTKPVEPEPVEETTEDRAYLLDHLNKPFSSTNLDFIKWFETEVASLDELDPDRILVAGYRMYSKFQHSDFNKTQREARKAARDSADGEVEEEEVTSTPARRTRTAPAKETKAATPGNGQPARPRPRSRSRQVTEDY